MTTQSTGQAQLIVIVCVHLTVAAVCCSCSLLLHCLHEFNHFIFPFFPVSVNSRRSESGRNSDILGPHPGYTHLYNTSRPCFTSCSTWSKGALCALQLLAQHQSRLQCSVQCNCAVAVSLGHSWGCWICSANTGHASLSTKGSRFAFFLLGKSHKKCPS